MKTNTIKRKVLALEPAAEGTACFGDMVGRFYTVWLPNPKGGRDAITGDRAEDTWESALKWLEGKRNG